jgi:hypothetical protein
MADISDIEKTASPAPSENHHPEKAISADADLALRFLRQDDDHTAAISISEKALLRKIDWMIMPVTSLPFPSTSLSFALGSTNAPS